ncbi:MAG: hypothetical protein ABIO64_04725 [Burkholderiaceae bacterium]
MECVPWLGRALFPRFYATLLATFVTDEQLLRSRLTGLEFGNTNLQNPGMPNANLNDFSEYEMSLRATLKIILVEMGIMSGTYLTFDEKNEARWQ